ncbi:hypothetical protein ACSQ49_000354 [Providencia stuartii]
MMLWKSTQNGTQQNDIARIGNYLIIPRPSLWGRAGIAYFNLLTWLPKGRLPLWLPAERHILR